ncbi:hypothetical protein AC478_02905 [miscellaneous Crenarchaeota group-1 archaeon SG8-32-3]|uniref:Uncharacterized protein n=1 Tax=miscellaneous Crenarchaeota group-1 archaeon SG8-32-3 TaxID=1685125 RepID=A0A0M0BSN8_9ARCH|nr:MAG: hypothetical protein AC478_02905 [miscellaneous Crenarchaeota group-1 archaeon SG8-32-3]
MNRKIGLMMFLFVFLIGAGNVLAEISVGVKKGDWIEYEVTYTGTPTVGHDVIWARMEIRDVQGKSISVDITVEHSNGTLEEMTVTLNLETGQLGDDFIIPANLNSGDTFFDKNVGNITISSIEERTYSGTTRTVAHAVTTETTYYWDKATGILIEGKSQLPKYTMNTIVDKTNIWQSQLLGSDPAVFYASVIGAVVLVVVVLSFLIVKRKK